MSESPEHKFVSTTLGKVLDAFSTTKLLGVTESDRKRFDFSCVIERDCSRPLVSQVLWSHTEGLEKDLRTLLHDNDCLVKTYFVRDSVKHRLRIDEVVRDYRSREATRKLLRGLRIIYLPPDFDADRDQDRSFMERYMSSVVCNDLLFSVAFGNLSRFDIDVFSDHGGPLGLKFAILDEITKHGLTHTPTFKERLGYSTTSPIREVITMLTAAGLAKRLRKSVLLRPTVKGRMLMDLTRRMLFEEKRVGSSPSTMMFEGELAQVVEHVMPGSTAVRADSGADHTLTEILSSAHSCRTQFGRDLLEGISDTEPQFYQTYDWRTFYEEQKGTPQLRPEFFSEPDAYFMAK